MYSTNVLFVEDNDDLRDNVALVLDMEGYNVRLARDGREALDLLDEGFVPHLIVSDIMMPRMNGYEFFDAVQQKPQLRGVPFIFLTARGSRGDISTGRMLGADDYLVKPFEPKEFLVAVRNRLKRAADYRAHAAESLGDARRVLVKMLSHELRTPLTYVTGGFAMLAEELEAQERTGEDIRTSLSLIQNGTERLNRLAEQMVLYSEIISGHTEDRIKKTSERLDLEDILTDTLITLDDLLEEREITVSVVKPDSPVIVCGVAELLIAAVGEVIRNAAQYSPVGSKIELLVGYKNNQGYVTVIDHGMGILAEDQPTIWNVLVQSDRERTEQQGMGMGLPITRGIINLHGGEAVLHSVRNEGTEITLRLPLAPSAGL